jgi:hypothetical protein
MNGQEPELPGVRSIAWLDGFTSQSHQAPDTRKTKQKKSDNTGVKCDPSKNAKTGYSQVSETAVSAKNNVKWEITIEMPPNEKHCPTRRVPRQQPQTSSCESAHSSNENKMSDGGRDRASLGMEGWKSSQNWSVQRSDVRSIAWLGLFVMRGIKEDMITSPWPWRTKNRRPSK